MPHRKLGWKDRRHFKELISRHRRAERVLATAQNRAEPRAEFQTEFPLVRTAAVNAAFRRRFDSPHRPIILTRQFPRFSRGLTLPKYVQLKVIKRKVS